MPYKDPEKKRNYQRDYKRRLRARAKLSKLECQTLANRAQVRRTPSQTAKRKAYICPKVPHLRLPGMIVFKNGFFVTDRPEEQRTIEADPLYREEIFGWVLDP